MKIARYLAAALGALICAACANTATLDVEYAPRVAGAEDILSISVLPFEGPRGRAFARIVESELASARFRGAPAVTLVDPSYAQVAWRGGRNDQLVSAGEDLNVDGVITGAVIGERVWDRPYTRKRSRCVKFDSDGACMARKEVRLRCWEVHADIDVRVLLVRVVDGRTLFNDVLSGDSVMNYCQDQFAPYSPDRLLDFALEDAARPVRTLFAPFERRVHARFARTPEDGLDAGFSQRFEAAYDLAGDNNEAACARFAQLARAEIVSAALSYNRGLCAEREGALDAAAALYREALQIQPGYALALEGLNRAREQMRERERLSL